MNLNEDILKRLESYRHKQMFTTKTEAIEFLLNFALRANPKREAAK